MPDNDARSQSTTGNTTSGTIETNPAGATGSLSSHDLSIDDCLTTCERLVDEAVAKDLPAAVLADSLKNLGLKAVEAIDYLEEFNQRITIRRFKAKQSESQHQDSPHGSPGPAHDQEGRDKAVDEAAWASLRSKLEPAGPAQSLGLSSDLFDKVFELIGQEVSPSATLSKSVLAVAPHLAHDEDTVFKDPYLGEMQKCKMAYSSQKPFDNLITKAQGRKMREPVANSIWRLVILDKYVDFEKLYATLEPGYNPNDEAKELSDKFTLVEKNSVSSKRSVLTEAEWIHLYDVWVDAVLHFYPHRRAEFASYRELVINMFRATVSPFPAIKYDRDSWERYSRQPCHLDSSKDVLPFPLLSQLPSHTSPPSSSSRGSKRKSVDDEAPKKRSETVCRNWNKGSCEGDTCRFGRRHNECCECNGRHRAKDRTECKAAFHSRQQPRASAAQGGRM